MSSDTPLLTYTVSASPSRLPVSDPQAQVSITAAAPADTPVYCGQILVSVPVGPGTTSLFLTPPTASVSANTWAPTTGPRRSADPYAVPGTTDDYHETVIYDSTSGTRQPLADALNLGLRGAVNDAVGDITLRIREISGTSPDPATFTPKEKQVMVRKTPADFYLRNVTAARPGSNELPRTEFVKGESIYLSWESNGSNFTISLPDRSASPGSDPTTSHDTGTTTHYELASGLTRDTTILLTATLTGGAVGGTTSGGASTDERLYATLPLTISNPVLTPTSVDVSTTLKVTGDSTLAGTTTAHLDAASATITAALKAATLTGTTATVDSLVTNKDLNSGWGNVSLFSQQKALYSGTSKTSTKQAATDGIIVVMFPITDNKTWETSVVIGVNYEEFRVNGSAQANEAVYQQPTMTIPVPKGAELAYKVVADTTKPDRNDAHIMWFPLGTASLPSE
ncbi:hypothetical protein ACFVIM_03425 [Streptomyces sp. NPDC057638]|uniref:hypothetical protein n=1 Tax=Streptomyces sp. NPDC057638 TaxID=3346190 RepID=UPI003699D144